MRVLKTPWKEDLMTLVSQSRKSIKITSPYVKENICNELLMTKRKEAQLELYTSFKLMNIHSGSLDLAGLENIISQNGIVKNVPKLHSKIYLFDDERVIITSGNLTDGGLLNNIEYGVYTEDLKVVSKIALDFGLFSKNEDVGTIKLKDIEMVRSILSKIPKSETVKLPKYDLGTLENNYDVIEIPEEILISSLKGWKLEILKCAQAIPSQEFSFEEISEFKSYLSDIYPENSHIDAKIRQQLQYLRDLGLIEFLGNGKYKKLWKPEPLSGRIDSK